MPTAIDQRTGVTTDAPIRGSEIVEPGAMFHVKHRCSFIPERCVPGRAWLNVDRASAHELLRGPDRLLLTRGAFAIIGLAVIVARERAKHDPVFHVKHCRTPDVAASPQAGRRLGTDRGGGAGHALLSPLPTGSDTTAIAVAS